MTISARRSANVVEENGLTSTKSMVPAMRVFSPWVEKRRIVLIPEFAGGKFLPILGLALAKRCDHTHAGNNDDRTIVTVAYRRLRVAGFGGRQAGFRRVRQETASKSAIPSPRQ